MSKKFEVTEFYRGKKIMITGTTGFVGKVILEKLLFSLEDIHIFILIRWKKGSSVNERFKKEIIDSACFSRLKQKHPNYVEWFQQKVTPIQGDLQQPNLGISEHDLKILQSELNVIINSAASVDFNARLDHSIRDNIEGTIKIYELGRSCKQLQSLLHISTAYVNCNRREQWIEEQIYPIQPIQQYQQNQTQFYNEVANNPYEYIMKLKATPEAQIELKTQEVLKQFNFPNTYTFTKFFCEHIVTRLNEKDRLPLTILRPSIVGCSSKDPYPGWLDSVSAASAYYLLVALGMLKQGIGNLDNKSDQVPVDYVADASIAVAAYYSNQPGIRYYNCCTTNYNPVTWNVAKQGILKYVYQNPYNKQVSKVSFTMTENKKIYDIRKFKQRIPVFLYEKYAKLTQNSELNRNVQRYKSALEKAEKAQGLFQYFTSNQWIFQSDRNKVLLNNICQSDLTKFQLDTTKINWEQYFTNFGWGLKYFIMKEHIDPPFKKDQIQKYKSYEHTFGDIQWVRQKKLSYQPTLKKKIIKRVLQNQEIISIYEKQGVKGYQNAHKLCEDIFSDYDVNKLRMWAYVAHKVFKRIFDRIFLDEEKLKTIKELEKSGPIVLICNTQSHFDFLILSYIFFTYDIKCPYVQSTNSLSKIRLITNWLKSCGGYFVDTENRNPLSDRIIEHYIKELLVDGANLEFFIENNRNRSGKISKPSNKILQKFIEDMIGRNNSVKNINVIPVSISYDIVYESDFIPLELVGEAPQKESLSKFLSQYDLIFKKLGRVFVEFGQTINLNEYQVNSSVSDPNIQQQLVKKESKKLLMNVCYQIQDMQYIMPIQIVSSILLMQRKGISEDQLIQRIDWLSKKLAQKGLKIGSVSQFSSQISLQEALRHLNKLVQRKRDMFGPQVLPKQQHLTLQLLSYNKNGILNFLYQEAIISVCLLSFGHQIAFNEGVKLERLMEEFIFLSNLLSFEFLQREDNNEKLFDKIIGQLGQAKAVEIVDQRVKGIDNMYLTYLASLVWPFVESYWITIVYIIQLKNNTQTYGTEKLAQQIQWYAESLAEESILEHYEAISYDSIRNSIKKYVSMDILKRMPNKQIELPNENQMIHDIEQHLQKLTKHSFSRTLATPINLERKNSLIDFPHIAKL